jgi:hypothetical protein
MSDQRVQYDGPELDEIVAEGVTLHIEAMDAHHFMIRAYRPERIVDNLRQDAIDIHLSGADLFEVEGTTGLPVINRPAIVYCHEWDDRSGRHHQCYERTGEHKRHKCSCGATTKRQP